MPLSQNRNTVERPGKEFGFTVANGTVIYQGSLVALNTQGLAEPAATSSPVGVAMQETLGGDIVVVRRGIFAFNNSINDPLTKADINKQCYVVDDCTVKKTAGTSPSAPVAGIIMDVDTMGVWVRI